MVYSFAAADAFARRGAIPLRADRCDPTRSTK
jgi:hypothetical protein